MAHDFKGNGMHLEHLPHDMVVKEIACTNQPQQQW